MLSGEGGSISSSYFLAANHGLGELRTWKLGRMGQPTLWQPRLALGARGAAGEPGAELPQEQGAVLHCHPEQG